MSADLKVLFILGCNEGPSARYRVFNHIEALHRQQVAAEWLWDIHPEAQDPDYLRRFSLIVNFRGGFSDRLERIFAVARELSIPTVYDIDDLVFDPGLADQIDAYRKMAPAQQRDYHAGMQSIERALRGSDFVTVSTPFLADYAARFAEKPVWIIPFGVNDRQVRTAATLPGYAGGPRFITYLSGTNTHERDFSEAVAALRRVLTEYDDVYLKLVGHLDIDTHLPGLRDKVIQIPFMHWKSLVFEAASAYVNIAPFEPGSPFCQSKSDLKYVEPGLSGVPTIASPISSFQASIKHGINGLIVDTADEWYQAFTSLLDDPDLRRRMGEAARLDVLRNRVPDKIGRQLVQVYSEIVDLHRAARGAPVAAGVRNPPASTNGLRIAWVIPQPFEASGGHRNIFRAIRYLSEFGHSCSLHVLPDNHRFSKGEEIRDFITKEFFDIKADEVFHGVNNIPECDIMVCTYWTTAYVLRDNAEKAPLKVYFLQDYEPMFFPMGTDYVRACETYRFGFYPITSGPWPLRILEKEWGITRGTFFRFPLERSIYYAEERPHAPQSRPRIVYFARPDMPRRCYPLGVAALEIVKRERPDVEIVFYGDKSEKFQHVPFEFTNVGMTPDIADLGNLYRSADVGVCFSTTNPSLVPFEMMACGLPVVDLDVNGNEVSYGGRDNCMLAAASPRDIADKIYAVLDNPALAQDLRARGIRYATEFPSEIEMVRLIEKTMISEFERSISAVPVSR